jgi:E3 ubiquitin-protein ligase DOA10
MLSLASSVPTDLLSFQLFLPWIVNWTKPKEYFRVALNGWSQLICKSLRLTSFIYGIRRKSQEKASVSWLPSKVHRYLFDSKPQKVNDGGLFRAPNYDVIPVKPGQKMIVPLTPEEKRLSKDGLHPENIRRLFGEDGKWTIVYLPSNYMRRVITLRRFSSYLNVRLGCDVYDIDLAILFSFNDYLFYGIR